MLDEREFGHHPYSSDHLHELVSDVDCNDAVTWLRNEVHDVERDVDLGMLLWVVDVDHPEECAVLWKGKVGAFVPPGVRTKDAGDVEVGVGGVVVVPAHDPS